jgi:hypothetical protein
MAHAYALGQFDVKDVCNMSKKVGDNGKINDYLEIINIKPAFLMLNLMNQIHSVIHSKQKQPFRIFSLLMFQTHIFEF